MDIIRKILLLASIFVVTSLSAQIWSPDVLNNNYYYRYVSQPKDYSGNVRCTIVRKLAHCKNSHRAILYVHGYNDYFFQKELGDRFVDSCYNFYAVDLRKYGRSLMPGQNKFEVHDMKEYFADIDSAMSQIVKDGNTSIILMGHSTGGLISSYYMAKDAGRDYPIKALILNSPFLDMNLSHFEESTLVPIVSAISNIAKNIKIPQGDSNTYAQSLLSKYHGEWDYNTDWKMEISPAVTSGWIGAIHKSQRFLQKGVNIDVPILLLHSDKSVGGGGWSPEHNNGDGVLDVNDISKYGRKLGSKITEYKVKGGLHDLFLSAPKVRNALYDKTFQWLYTVSQ